MKGKKTALVIVFVAAVSAPYPVWPQNYNISPKKLHNSAADPYAFYISNGPKHEYEPTYYVPGADTCPVKSYRVILLRYAFHYGLVVEEMEFTGDKCTDMKVAASYYISGVNLGYQLKRSGDFAKDMKFVRWDAWDIFVIESGDEGFRFQISPNGTFKASLLDETGM